MELICGRQPDMISGQSLASTSRPMRRLILALAIAFVGMLVSAGVASANVTVEHHRDGSTVFTAGAPRAHASAGHWGHIHIVGRPRRKKLQTAIEDIQDFGIAAGAVGLLFAIPSDGVSIVIVNGFAALGSQVVVNALQRARSKSRRNPPLRIDAGLWCYHIPFAPDPCRPRVQIRARQ